MAQKFPKTVLAQQALYDEWGIHFNVKQDESAARKVMDEYEKQFGEDEMLFTMMAAMGELTEDMIKRLQKPSVKSQQQSLPSAFALHNNYPNPFNPTTNIVYELPQEGVVRLEIYNVLGQRAVLLSETRQEAGRHIVHWDGRTADGTKASAGIYFCRMTAGDFSKTIKITLLP